MAAQKRPARRRVGRVSYYQHHGSWYLYYRDATGIRRPRIGRSEAEAERAAALKNAELTTGEVSRPQQLVIAPPAPPGCGDVDRRSFVANVAALLGGLLELGQGLNANAAFPALSAPTIDVPPVPPPGPATPVATLRDEFVDHHEHVLGSSLGTVKRYSSATQHLVDYAVREGIADARDISASKFTRYLREIEVAANGHKNASPRSMSEKTISFMLQTCGSMYRFGVEQKLLPHDATVRSASAGFAN